MNSTLYLGLSQDDILAPVHHQFIPNQNTLILAENTRLNTSHSYFQSCLQVVLLPLSELQTRSHFPVSLPWPSWNPFTDEHRDTDGSQAVMLPTIQLWCCPFTVFPLSPCSITSPEHEPYFSFTDKSVSSLFCRHQMLPVTPPPFHPHHILFNYYLLENRTL